MEMPALADLLDVQDLDLQIDRLMAQRRGLPELQLYRQSQQRIDALEIELGSRQAELRDLELAADKAEGELEILEAKLGEHETRLFAGGMSARETEHMRLEVESLRGQREASEERVLGLLDRLDPARGEAGRLETEVASVRSEKDRLETLISAEWAKIDAELARKQERRAEAISPVGPELQELYERLRRTKEGVAIGRLEDGTCGGCHIRLSATEQIEAAEADPPRCVHCRRLLVP